MAFGIGAPGQSPEAHAGETRFKTLEEYREQIRAIVQQGVVDIMLMSASTNHALTIRERIFEGSAITPAARANDTTDVHIARGSHYAQEPAPAVPVGQPRPHPVRPPRLLARGAGPRRRPRPVQRHLQQRPGPRPGDARAVPPVPRGGRAEAVPLLPRSVRPQRPRGDRPGHPALVPQRHDRPDARGGRPERPSRLPEDRLPRAQGDGGAGPVRPPPRRRHPRRLRRHHARRLPDARRRPEVRGQGRPLRPEDQLGRESARLRPVSSA